MSGSWGGYVLGEPVGMGSTAAVYRARRGDEVVALKILHPHLAGEPLVRARFLREAALARRIEHPAILRVYDVIVPDDPEEPPALVMELCEGGNLTGWRPAGPEELAVLARDVAAALRAAHQRGVVHRDLKPSNILRDGSRFRVCDFGSAGVQDSVSLSTSSLFVDTPVYVAPEVFEGHPADPRSDLYSLGAILYEAATGAPARRAALPTRAETPARGPLDAVLPVWLADLVVSLLGPLESRPPDAATVCRALERRLAAPRLPMKSCLFCGASLPLGAPVCLGCGESELGLHPPPHGEAWCVTLRSIREDAATVERVTALLRALSGRPDFELELMFGDPRYYSREERKRKRKLPVRIVEGLDAEDARRLQGLLARMKVKCTVHAMRWVKTPKQGPLIPGAVPGSRAGSATPWLTGGAAELSGVGEGAVRLLGARLYFAVYGLEEAARNHELGELVRPYPRVLHGLTSGLIQELRAVSSVGVSRADLQTEVVRTTVLGEDDDARREARAAAVAALEKYEEAQRRRTQLTTRVLGLCGALEAVSRELEAGGSTREREVRLALEELSRELSPRASSSPPDPDTG